MGNGERQPERPEVDPDFLARVLKHPFFQHEVAKQVQSRFEQNLKRAIRVCT